MWRLSMVSKHARACRSERAGMHSGMRLLREGRHAWHGPASMHLSAHSAVPTSLRYPFLHAEPEVHRAGSMQRPCMVAHPTPVLGSASPQHRAATLRSSACRASHTIHPEHKIFSALHRMASLLVHPTQPEYNQAQRVRPPLPFPSPGHKHRPG